MPAYVERSLDEFVGGSDQEILAELHRSYAADGFVTQYTSQAVSWDASLGLLRTALSEVQREVPGAGAWRILLEYPLYRLRRRIDAIVLAERVAMVIEVKFGESRFEASDRRQVEEYALDLRDFHAPSRSIALVPILWCTAATAPTVYPPLSGPGVADVHLAGQNDLGDLIRRAVAASDALPLVAKEDWSAGAYRPVPSVIDAATTLFAGHGVEEIARADAKNLGAASEHIVALVADSRTRGSRALIFLTGVPGSGKTLAGLQVVHRAADPDLEAQGDIVYLSGNTPLVTVLREALARDEYNRRKTAGTHVRMADVRNAMRARIQHIIDFLRQYLTCPGEEPPHEHAIVFDEAQRAWDARHGAQKFGRTASEPALLLEIMSRHTDWSALVGLIGGGQEINTGENGIAEWGDALRALPEDERARWTVYGPSSVIDGDRSTAFLGLGELPQDLRVVHDDALRLEVPLRTFRTPKLAEWVEAVLRGNGVAARDLASQVEAYPLVLTRDLETARAWLKRMGRGERRYGLVASSGATRLRAEGLGVSLNATDGNKIAQWYLNGPGDVRSSFSLEVTANEYTTQGLELDFVGLCWGGDLVRGADSWVTRQFRGNRWVAASSEDRRRFILNSYRVLFTRAREGLLIWVPRGDHNDPTRSPELLDRTTAFLRLCGMTDLEE